MMIGPLRDRLLTLACAALLTGCAAPPINPSFPITLDDAKADLRRMEDQPVRLERPVVVIGGFADPLGLAPDRLGRTLRRLTGDDRVLSVSMGGVVTFDGARHKTLASVQEAFPTNDPHETVEVDVVGFSMGGLVARSAAVDPAEGGPSADALPRLRIARLFTIATPHRGAAVARLPLGPLVRDMSPGSAFLAALDDADASQPTPRASGPGPRGFATYHYVRLDDHIVGEANAAPPGQTPWWVHDPALQMSHGHAYKDPRIVADIARRLRGETPFTRQPPAPFPDR